MAVCVRGRVSFILGFLYDLLLYGVRNCRFTVPFFSSSSSESLSGLRWYWLGIINPACLSFCGLPIQLLGMFCCTWTLDF